MGPDLKNYVAVECAKRDWRKKNLYDELRRCGFTGTYNAFIQQVTGFCNPKMETERFIRMAFEANPVHENRGANINRNFQGSIQTRDGR